MADAGAWRIRRLACTSAAPASRRALLHGLSRRAVLHGLTALLATTIGAPRFAHAATNPDRFPDGASLLVGGPAGGTLSAWAIRLSVALLEGQPDGAELHRREVGGADGVTGANQFEARVAPDGQTALLAPGAAALAWLAGDPRAHYDVAKWLPIMAGVAPGIVCGRGNAAALALGSKVRMAASSAVGPELPALLALDLLGVAPVPVFGIQDAAAARTALAEGRVDAVFVHGAEAGADLAALTAIGAIPLFGMGLPDDTGATRRDPLTPDLLTLPELAIRLRGGPPGGLLYAAWQACAAAAELDFALVLPVLAPAAMVSLWRKAAVRMAAAPQLQAPAQRLLPPPAANAVLSAVAADAPVLVELRRWMAARLNWQPS
jgi:hypothetical protein